MTEIIYEPILRERVLAIDPVSRGFGFVVLEGDPLQLVDWGVCHCARATRDECLQVLRRMLARYQPTAIVIEDAREARSLRAFSLEAFVASVADALVDGPVPLRTYSRNAVREAFRSAGASTKEEIAGVLAARFPELAPRRPRPRRVWESEDARMSIFDALSFAMTHLASGGR